MEESGGDVLAWASDEEKEEVGPVSWLCKPQEAQEQELSPAVQNLCKTLHEVQGDATTDVNQAKLTGKDKFKALLAKKRNKRRESLTGIQDFNMTLTE